MGGDRPAASRLSDRRFWVDPAAAFVAGERLQLGDEAAKHARVCRLVAGDGVEVFDGQGRKGPAVVREVSSRRLELELTASAETLPLGPDVQLVLCLPRAGKLDDILRMVTELGVRGVHLAQSEHSVGTATRAAAKLDRLGRVAREALRQCEGAYLPEIHAAGPLADVVGRAPVSAQRAVLVARGGQHFRLAPRRGSTWLVVGPEGGLSEGEERALLADGFAGLSLGPSVLRVETAAVVATALALHALRADEVG